MKSSLLHIVLLPFLLLMLSLGVTIGWVLYRSGEEVTDAVAQKTLETIAIRIENEIERQLSRAQIILNVVAPETVQTPDKQLVISLEMPRDLSQIELRLWSATGLFSGVDSNAYFAFADGSFVGLDRKLHEGLVAVRYRLPDAQKSEVFSMAGPQKKMALLLSDQFDPRNRPWYINTIETGRPGWSPAYVDFNRQEPMLTLSKPVFTLVAGGAELVGVAATDLSLKLLSRFLQSIDLPFQCIAFVMERSGELVASSLSEIPYVRLEGSKLLRQTAFDSTSPMTADVSRFVRDHMASQLIAGKPLFKTFDDAHRTLQISATLLKDERGLDWISVIAVPRSSISIETSSIIKRSLTLSLGVIFISLAIGILVLRWTVGDIRKLAEAARNIRGGAPFKDINIHRKDEIGVLAASLQDMEQHLRSDALTKLLNRDTFIAQIDFKQRRMTDPKEQQFSILYIDLDNFKTMNDTYGHAAGDKVLIEVAQRLHVLIRKEDAAARFGGDEFVVYLHGTHDVASVKQLCMKLQEKLEAPIDLGGGQSGRVGASIGLATYPADGLDIETLLRVADTKMFNEKKRHKAQSGEI